MSDQYVTKPYRQRTSMVTSLPIGVRVKLGLSNGDHIVWQVNDDSNFVQISKVVPGVKKNGRDSRSSNRES